jgi:predicted amidohydrolase
MKIALLQLNPATNPEQNFQKTKPKIAEAARAGADIALLPELWTVGYTAPEEYEQGQAAWRVAAMSQQDDAFRRYVNLARDNSIAVALGYLERDGEQFFDSVALIDMNGRLILNYRKVHTVRKNWEIMLDSGKDFAVAELKIKNDVVKIGCMICYDREFPEVARILMHKGAEIILVPNASDIETNRLAQLQARGYENMLGIAMTNYPTPRFNGRSTAFDGMRKKGEEYNPQLVLANAAEGIFYADFDIDELRRYREREIWGDAYRKPWLYGELVEVAKSYPFVRDNAD